jgi:outer membrane murein-binding lipoprotein Lpp
MALKDDLNNLKDGFDDINDLASGAESSFRDIAQEIKKISRDSVDFKNTFKIAAELTKDLEKSAKELAQTDKETIKDRASINKLSRDAAKLNKSRANLESKIRVLRSRTKNATEEEQKILERVDELLSDAKSFTGDIEQGFNEIKETAEEIARKNPFKGIADIVSSVPVLNKLLSNLVTASDEFSKNMADSRGFFKSLTAGFTEYIKLSAKAAQVFIGTQIIKAITSIDQASVDLSNQLMISKTSAAGLQIEFAKSAQQNRELLQSSRDLIKSQVELGGLLGTNARFTSETNSTFGILTERVGIAKDAAAGLAQFTLATGQSFKEFSEEAMGTTKVLNLLEGSAINQKEIFADINNTSNATKLSLTAQGISLNKAAFSARKLGLNLAQGEQISAGLLDFESSIAAELEAELLTGRELNLERARQLALNNDTAGVLDEISKQGITQEKFSNMNRIQQEAIAKALGMSREEMGDMFVQQGALNSLSAKNDQEAIEAIQKRIRDGEKLSDIIKDTGSEELVNRAQNISMQEKLNKLIEDLSDKIIGPLVKVFETIDGFLTNMNLNSGKIGGALLALAIGGPIIKGVRLMFKLFGGIGKLVGGITGGFSKLFKSDLFKKGAKSLIPGGEKVATATMKATGNVVSGAAAQSAVKAGSATAKTFVKSSSKVVGKSAAKAAGKSILKKIPGIGLIAGLAFAAERLSRGDFSGAGLEVASGAASLIPGIGTAASLALDAGIAARDMGAFSDDSTSQNIPTQGNIPSPRPINQQELTRDDNLSVVGLMQNLNEKTEKLIQLQKDSVMALETNRSVSLDTSMLAERNNINFRGIN